MARTDNLTPKQRFWAQDLSQNHTIRLQIDKMPEIVIFCRVLRQ